MNENSLQKIMDGLVQLDASDGLDVNELLRIPDDLRQLLTWMVRAKRFMVDDLVEYMGINESQASELLSVMLRKGFIELTAEPDEPQEYRTRLTGTFKRRFRVQSDVWKLLEE